MQVVTGCKPLTGRKQRLTFWFDNIAARKVCPSTPATYRGYVWNRIVPVLGGYRLEPAAGLWAGRLATEACRAGRGARPAGAGVAGSLQRVHPVLRDRHR
jgi:hypothetical protein